VSAKFGSRANDVVLLTCAPGSPPPPAGRIDQRHPPLARLSDAGSVEHRAEAVGEGDVGDRGVLVALGLDSDGLRARQDQRQVEVVHHQVEHAGDVEVARAGRAAPRRLDAQRTLGRGGQAHGGEERPLLMPAGQHHAPFDREVDERGAVAHRGGERLFDVGRRTLVQGCAGHLVM
jgi:hypothetical protein